MHASATLGSVHDLIRNHKIFCNSRIRRQLAAVSRLLIACVSSTDCSSSLSFSTNVTHGRITYKSMHREQWPNGIGNRQVELVMKI